MRSPLKMVSVMLVLFSGFLLLGQVYAVPSGFPIPENLEAQALACLTEVFPVDLSHYNVTMAACYTLPSAPSDPYMTQAVDYMLNSPDSNLVANFLFRDASMYSLSLRVINGSVIPDKQYANLTDAAADVMAKYGAFSGADSTGMISLLRGFDDTKGATVTSGGYTLWASHLVISNVANGTTFDWTYTADGPDIASASTVSLTFDRGAFYALIDMRQFHVASSDQAIYKAQQFIQNYALPAIGANVSSFNVTRLGACAVFCGGSQNGTMQPCWDVTVNLNQPYPDGVHRFLVKVWADTGEVFNYTTLALPTSGPTTTPLVTPKNPAANTVSSAPEFSAVAAVLGTVLACTAVLVVWFERKAFLNKSN